MKLAIGNDHAGFKLKEKIKNYLIQKGYELTDFGAFCEDSVDYPDFAKQVTEEILSGKAHFGILICGTGNGINMTANKFRGIRSALCWKEEIAKLARQHNDANILALPGRFIEEDEARKIVDAFLCENFEGGRHQRRVEKINP